MSTKHPNTAKGIAGVHLSVPSSLYAEVVKQITSVVGIKSEISNEKESSWELTTYATSDGLPTPRIVLRSSADIETEGLSVSISEIAFWVEKKSCDGGGTPYGKIVWKGL